MRRRHRKNEVTPLKKILKISFVFILILLFISLGYSYLQKSLNVSGTSRLNIVHSEEQVACEEYDGYATQSFDVTLTRNTWGGGTAYYFQYNIFIKNDTSSAINSWQIELYVPEGTGIGQGWGTIVNLDGNHLTIDCMDYACKLSPGNEANVGIQIITPTSDFAFGNISINKEVATPSGNLIYSNSSCSSKSSASNAPARKSAAKAMVKNSILNNDFSLGSIYRYDENIDINYNISDTISSDDSYEYKEINYEITNISDYSIDSWNFDINSESGNIVKSISGANYVNGENVIKLSNDNTFKKLESNKAYKFSIIVGVPNSNLQSSKKSSKKSLLPYTYLANLISNYESDGYNYYQYEITVSNISENLINGWNIDYDLNGATIEGCWNALYEVSNDSVSFTNESYNGNIESEQSVTFGVIFKTKAFDFSI